MTRRTHWPEEEDCGGPASSRAEAGPSRTAEGSRWRGDREPEDGHVGEHDGGYEGAYGGEYGAAYDGDGAGPEGEGRGRGKGKQRGASRQKSREKSQREAQRELEQRDPVERARSICLRLLTGSARTRQQLADELRKREIPEEAAEEVLARLEGVGLIDDAAFAESWVDSRHQSRGLSRRALARELRTKGVDSELIDEAVGRLDADQEAETARELVERKMRSTRGLDREKRIRRLAGMLARKGYSEGLALRVVRQALEEEGEDPELLESHLPDA
ncbi:recombination regulator RecX [Streptomyces sp. ODS28]|uniref:recombination regulator RecX n=1 Tax=Streptomyces sp. ODS28 TaxID=3136688 RepID=UPI0031E82170